MTKSPLAATFIPLIPLAALGWPLAAVINQDIFVQEPEEETEVGPLATAELFIVSAHPFDTLSITVGKATWTFGPDDWVKEFHYPHGSSISLTAKVTWPTGTPETAALLTIRPEGLEDQEFTIWGIGEGFKETTLTWESQE